jgi:hypothetical protein
MSSTASAAILGTWVPCVATTRTGVASRSFSSVIEAVAQFEGTVQAYSVSGDPTVEEQVLLASDGISSSLESLNAELTEIYPSLDKVEQDAIVEAYSSMGSYLVDLADEANQIFQEGGKSNVYFQATEIDEVFLQGWEPQQ